jgi:hypothetical protein
VPSSLLTGLHCGMSGILTTRTGTWAY